MDEHPPEIPPYLAGNETLCKNVTKFLTHRISRIRAGLSQRMDTESTDPGGRVPLQNFAFISLGVIHRASI
jgi:hypothetical protein